MFIQHGSDYLSAVLGVLEKIFRSISVIFEKGIKYHVKIRHETVHG
jgi:hypothetical protein